jgi:hypothetical protein
MRLGRCRSVALVGVQGTVVDIDVHIGGMPGFTLVGLPDASLYEARDRVRAAVLSSGESWPLQKITVSLSPAALPKRGSHFDLGVAVAIMAAADEVPESATPGVVFLGELALDGRLRSVPGVLPAVLAASKAGVRRVVVPERNVAEARQIPDVSVVGTRSLRQTLAFLRGVDPPDDEPEEVVPPLDAVPQDPGLRPRGAVALQHGGQPGRRELREVGGRVGDGGVAPVHDPGEDAFVAHVIDQLDDLLDAAEDALVELFFEDESRHAAWRRLDPHDPETLRRIGRETQPDPAVARRADLVHRRRAEPAVHRTVAFPQNHPDVFKIIPFILKAVPDGIPDSHLIKRDTQGISRISAQVLIRQKENPFFL